MNDLELPRVLREGGPRFFSLVYLNDVRAHQTERRRRVTLLSPEHVELVVSR